MWTIGRPQGNTARAMPRTVRAMPLAAQEASRPNRTQHPLARPLRAGGFRPALGSQASSSPHGILPGRSAGGCGAVSPNRRSTPNVSRTIGFPCIAVRPPKGCKNGTVKYALLVVAAGLLFGTTGTARALAPVAASSLSVGSARLAFGGLLLGIVGLIAHRRRTGGWPRRRPTIGEAVAVVVGAGVVMGYQAVFFDGTRSNGVMVGTMLALGSAPMLAGVIEWIVLRHRPSLWWLVATVIGVAGVVALSWSTDSQDVVHPLGVMESLVAGACFAVLAVCVKWLLLRGWHPLDIAASVMGVGAVMAFPALAATDATWLASPRGVGVVAWLAVATMVIAYTLNVTGMAGTSAAAATTLNLSEPATATVLGIVLLGEHLTVLRALGIAAIAAGVLILGLTARSAPEPTPNSTPSRPNAGRHRSR